MNETNIDIETVRWTRIGRRWRSVLCAMLVVNGVTVVWAACDKAMSAPAGAALAKSDESPDGGASAEQPNATESVEPVVSAQPSLSIDARLKLVESAQADEPFSAAAPAAVTLAAEDKDESIDKPANGNDVSSAVAATDIAVNKPEVKYEAENGLTGMLLIINPPSTGGVVHYMIDGKTISLTPGEYRKVRVDDVLRVQYHRGGDLADEEQQVRSGAYLFGVSDAGWELTRMSSDAIQRILRLCRLVE